MRRKFALRALLSGVLVAFLGASPAALTAGGDVAWSNDDPATTVAYHAGKVFAAGIDEFGTFDVVISAYRAKNGKPLWDSIRIPPPASVAQIAAHGNYVVVAGSIGPFPDGDWFVAAYSIKTGAQRWFTIVPDDTFGAANSLVIIGNRVVVTGTELAEFFPDAALGYFVTRGFDLKTGELVWTDMDDRFGQSYGDKVVAASGDDDDDDFEFDDDYALFGRDDDDDDDDDDGDDDYEGALAVAWGLVAHPETGLIAGPEDGRDQLIRAYNPRNGDIVWSRTIDKRKFEGGVDAFAVQGRVAYFAFNAWDLTRFDEPSGHAGAVDVLTGALLWQLDEENGPPFLDGLAVQGDRLVVAADCGLFRLDTNTGAILWIAPPIDSCPFTPTFARGRLVTSGFAFTNFPFQNVSAYTPQDGVQVWTTDLVAEQLLHPAWFNFNVSDSIVTGRGMVFVGGVAVPGGFAELRAYKVR